MRTNTAHPVHSLHPLLAVVPDDNAPDTDTDDPPGHPPTPTHAALPRPVG